LRIQSGEPKGHALRTARILRHGNYGNLGSTQDILTHTRLLEKAGLRHIRIHDLRHTYATLLQQAGAPITFVSGQMGYRDASITLRVYAHYLPSA
jgi:integrase